MDNHTEPADGLAIAADAAEMLPLDVLAAVADLVDPAAVAREMPGNPWRPSWAQFHTRR
jgi:hypothetical protein